MSDVPERPKRKKPRVTTSLRWIERGDLAPWMFKYVQWLAQQPEAVLSRAKRPGEKAVIRGRPYTQERTAAANRFACRKIDATMLQALERRPDVIEYFAKLRADLHFMAKESMKQDVMDNIEARREALQHSRAKTVLKKKADGTVEVHPDGTPMTVEVPPDVKAIDSLTRWVPEFVFPKKDASEAKPPTIVLHLGGAAAAALALGQGPAQLPAAKEEIPDVEWEEIPQSETETEEDGE